MLISIGGGIGDSGIVRHELATPPLASCDQRQGNSRGNLTRLPANEIDLQTARAARRWLSASKRRRLRPVGGRGSGGRNRLPADEHLRRGTFRPGRHAGVGKMVVLPAMARADVPPAPALDVEGLQLWSLLWSQAIWLTELDAELVADACRSADHLSIAVRRYSATTDPSDLRAVALATSTKSKLLAALGCLPADRARLVAASRPLTKLDELRR